MKIAFLTKKEKLGVEEAIELTKAFSKNVDVYSGTRFNKFPNKLLYTKYDYLISYLSPWIVPKEVLNNTKISNINFHPGPPEYPGTGCFNFAIYQKEKQYGCTAHLMEPSVDTGLIIGVERFDMSTRESVETLSIKTYKAMVNLYSKIIDNLVNSGSLKISNEQWRRKPYIRKELELLARIDPNCSEEELELKIRSTYYPGAPAPFIEIKGRRFEYNPER